MALINAVNLLFHAMPYDLPAAGDVLNREGAARLPQELHDSFRDIVSNLASYRPYSKGTSEKKPAGNGYKAAGRPENPGRSPFHDWKS